MQVEVAENIEPLGRGAGRGKMVADTRQQEVDPAGTEGLPLGSWLNGSWEACLMDQHFY